MWAADCSMRSSAAKGLCAFLVLRGEMTAGMIFASSIIAGRALQPLDQLVAGWKQSGEANKAWKRLKAAVAPLMRPAQAKFVLPEAVNVENLVYIPPGLPPGSEPIIKRISFDIRPGETVALIGPSRAGKSTLARRLTGTVQPTGGSVSIDGADLRTWNDDQIGRAIGYLAQDVQLCRA